MMQDRNYHALEVVPGQYSSTVGMGIIIRKPRGAIVGLLRLEGFDLDRMDLEVLAKDIAVALGRSGVVVPVT